jgi:hypothetical protein
MTQSLNCSSTNLLAMVRTVVRAGPPLGLLAIAAISVVCAQEHSIAYRCCFNETITIPINAYDWNPCVSKTALLRVVVASVVVTSRYPSAVPSTPHQVVSVASYSCRVRELEVSAFRNSEP